MEMMLSGQQEASQSEQTLAITFSCPIMPHLVMTNFVTSRKFLEKIETFVSERETISQRLTRWVAGAVTRRLVTDTR